MKIAACKLLMVSAALAVMLSGCSTTEHCDYRQKELCLTKVPVDAPPAVEETSWVRALKAFRISCRSMAGKSVWQGVCARAQFVADEGAEAFFRDGFDFYRALFVGDDGKLTGTGLMTGYYEPMLRGSLTREGPYQYPIYGVPDDLIEVDLFSLYPELKGKRLRGKVVGRKLVPFDDRASYEKRTDTAGAVLCYVDDPVEAAFLQIQGSGRVLLTDGSFLRLGYADQNGHPYRAIGRWLINSKGLPASSMSMQTIKAWAREHPEEREALLNYNPNIVFFERREGFSDDEGPLGAQGVPLTALGSVAVDRRFWTMGLPFVVHASQTEPTLEFTRAVVAQDTGGAIRGPVRFDFFWGYGDEAGSLAGKQKSRAQAWVLIPKDAAPGEVL